MPVARFIAVHRGKRVDTAGEYDIIVLDPPYADPAIPDTLETIALSPLLSESGIVVIGHANRVKLADDYGGGRIKRVRHRNMGDSAFSIYEVAQEADGRQEPDQLVE
jgi:16S rRNA G966 N2-methylase RsmD